ncbi:MAG: ATP-dependent helicase [Candidatus Dormibacteria bacterium]
MTSAQKEVVEQRGRGPVKVAAAAGSGKTKTMAALYALRVGEGVHPSRIMAVTFTDRAAVELRQRIVATLEGAGISAPGGPDSPLEGAWIGTFHQLARRLLGEQPYLAELPGDLSLVDEVEAQVLLGEAAEFVRGQFAAGQGVGRWLPERPDLRAMLGLIDGGAAAVTKLRSTDLDGSTCRMLTLEALRRFETAGDPPLQLAWHRCALEVTVAIWEELERRLAAQRALDFDGLLRQALAALRDSPRLAAWCHSNFQLIIVDEYQDTSTVQNALLEQLVGGRREKLFVVGDARQSIFAFRDAKPGIMTQAAGRAYSLFLNHRSLAPILAAADHVIRGDPQFAKDQAMEVGRARGQPQPVLLGLAPTVEAEAEGIAQALEMLRRGGITHPDGTRQEVEYGDMAVLAYTFNRLGPALEEALRRRRIPFQTATGGLLDRPEVKDALALLRLLNDDADDQAWVRVLQSPWVRVSDRDLLALVGDAKRPGAALGERVRTGLEAGGAGLHPGLRPRLERLLKVTDELRALALVRPAAEVLSAALDQSGLLAYQEARSLAGDPDGQRSLAALRDLQRIALQAQAAGRWLGLGRLLERIASISDASGRAEPAPRGPQQVVTLSTIHRAKGLEWPVVVLGDCRPHHERARPVVLWDRAEAAIVMSRVGDDETGAGARWKRSAEAAVAREEHRRLVYVAMTRACDLLLVTTTRPGVKGAGAELDQVLDHLWQGASPKSEFAELVAALAAREPWVSALPGFPEAVELPWATAPAVSLPGVPDGGVRAVGPDPVVLEQRWRALSARPRPMPSGRFDRAQQLSFSALQTMARCPRQFWFRHVANFQALDPDASVADEETEDPAVSSPRGRSGALEMGTMVHRILEDAHRQSRDLGPRVADLETLLAPHRHTLGPEQAAEVELMLRGYASLAVAGLPTVAVELAFSWREWAGADLPPLVGAIDRVARLPSGELLVIDYKTNVRVTKAELVDYAHQLRLYVAALQAGLLGEPVAARAAILMLRSGELQEVDCAHEAMQLSLAWARNQAKLTNSAATMSGLDNPDRPCQGCQFEGFCPERRPPQGAGKRPG